jgi:hypothetical protein
MIRILSKRFYRIRLSSCFTRPASPTSLFLLARLDNSLIFGLDYGFEHIVSVNGLAKGNICPDSDGYMDVFGFLPFSLAW